MKAKIDSQRVYELSTKVSMFEEQGNKNLRKFAESETLKREHGKAMQCLNTEFVGEMGSEAAEEH